MRHQIQISDPSVGEGLADFLGGLCFDIARVDEHTLAVRFREPVPANEEAARLELDLYLRVWEAMNPDAWATRLD